jgi:predicted phage baseplate assembly protein
LTLTLHDGLTNQYDPATVTIYGNVAAATHGETKQEVLGSGDASQAYQQFTLKQLPLTYIASTAPSGGDSTLQVRVNDLLWHEVPAFYDHGPHERIFVTRLGDDGITSVEFGDGSTGARLPTGRENVAATYRKGIGTAGNLDSQQISLLITRPLGVKSVINPQPATLGADRESLGDARRNAPLTVLTLERIVSLQDYEDFARAFSGVAKALATWTWTGEARGVFVTVAGPDGALILDNSKTHDNLVAAMKAAGDPYIPLRVQDYDRVYFKLGVAVQLDPDYEPQKVLAAVEQTLRTIFSFDTRAFGQAVALSEVVAVIQGVDGVVAVDVTKLYRTDDPAGPGKNDVLLAAVPQAGVGALPGSQNDNISPAELLILSPDPLDELGVMK